MSEHPGQGGLVAELIIQLGRAAYADCAAGGLTQAQWMALRYFSRANRFSRTVTGYAEFHATTRGTASQTVKSLVSRGLLSRTRSTRDGRSSRFDLTPMARDKLADDPLEQVTRAAAALPPGRLAATVESLRGILRRLAEDRGRPAAGACALCGHLGGDGDTGYECRLMRESLAQPELQEICVRFVPVAAERRG